jgi:kynurenine 3-monooxygenase
MPVDNSEQIAIVGAGLAGSLMAILLARRGHPVTLFERFSDMRRTPIPAGRSINLALAARGIRALEDAGTVLDVLPLLIPMRGRMLHAADGSLSFMAYGQRDHEVIYSVSRPGLNRLLLDAAEQAGVQIQFAHTLVQANLSTRQLHFARDGHDDAVEVTYDRVIAADGAGSLLRRALTEHLRSSPTEDLLPHRYKELTLGPDMDGRHRLEKNALHIWPRGGFMLIALPNIDGSFTFTLFLPELGPISFEALNTAANIDAFFAEHFPDARQLMPHLADEFAANPAGVMGTVRCSTWALRGELLLLGDAAHAITPFHGQGMNCAFEDCAELALLLDTSLDWEHAFAEFERARKPNTDAIANMALENYLEMRDSVRDPKFVLQKALSLELEKRFPERFVPRYSMVMFHDEIPYRVALERGRLQSEILDTLTQHAQTLAEVDFGLAATLIQQRLSPIASRATH